MHGAWSRLLHLVFPPRCVICQQVQAGERLCCDRCKAGLVECGVVGPEQLSALVYNDTVRPAVLRIKHRQDADTFRFLANEMIAAQQRHWPGYMPELLVPVPISRAGLRRRGFNQARELASALGSCLNRAVVSEALVRMDHAEVQHTLNKAARLENAHIAYEAGREIHAVSARRVLLVDDVYTTGATASACRALLRAAGADDVHVITAVYTPKRQYTQMGTKQ